MTNFEKYIGEIVGFIDDDTMREIACGLRCYLCPENLKEWCSDPKTGKGSCDDIFLIWAKAEARI